MNETTSMIPAGFNGAEQSGLAQRAAAGSSSTARAELEAMCAMARLNPRNEHSALTSMINAAKRPLFAESATYSFPRGKKQDNSGQWVDNYVTGPSVNLARPIATYWGHIRFGFRIVDDDEDYIGLEGFAHDLQTGAYCTMPARFKKLVQRKVGTGRDRKTEWVKPDERDLRELVNKQGAILVRNCVLSVVPPDIVDAVLQECDKTLHDKESGALKDSREDTVRKLVLGWAEFGVTAAELEAVLGHPMAQITPDELVRLRGMFRSIRDGNTKVSDHFRRDQAAPQTNGETPSAKMPGKVDLTQAREGTPVNPPGGATVGDMTKKDEPAAAAANGEASAKTQQVDAFGAGAELASGGEPPKTVDAKPARKMTDEEKRADARRRQ